VGGVVELVEGLSGSDEGSLGEEPFLHDAGYLRTDLRHHKGRGAPRQFAGEGDGLRLERDNRYLRRGAGGHGWSGFFAATGGKQREKRGGRQNEEAGPETGQDMHGRSGMIYGSR